MNLAVILRAVPILMIAGGVGADIYGPKPYGGLPFLVAAPLVACLVMSWWTSFLLVVVTCAISAILNTQLHAGEGLLISDLVIIIFVSVIGLWTKWWMDRQAQQLKVTRDIAAAAQRAILPDPPTRLSALRIAARYDAAQVEAHVGGDLYAVQATPFGTRAIIGDVRGKGLQAVSKVAMVISTFRNEADSAATLTELADRLNEAFIRAKDPTDIDYYEDFCTALIVEVSPDGDMVSLLNRGHTAPYLMHSGRVDPLEPSSPAPPLGLDLPFPYDAVRPEVVRWPPNAILLLITDGITEARNEHGHFFDPRVGLARSGHSSPRDVVDALAHSINRWTKGNRQDDVAILAIAHAEFSSGNGFRGREGQDSYQTGAGA